MSSSSQRHFPLRHNPLLHNPLLHNPLLHNPLLHNPLRRCSARFWVNLPLLVVVAFSAAGCSSHPPIRTAPSVDLDRFMGDWYVLAHIPAPLEREAFDAVESYARGGERRIETTYRFRNGGLDGPWEVHTPTGFVRDDPSNAHWGMQFIWPFRMEYRIVHVDPDYSQTIIGRSRRDYAWIMARDPRIPAAELEALKEILVEEGYDLTELRLVPHGSAVGESAPRR